MKPSKTIPTRKRNEISSAFDGRGERVELVWPGKGKMLARARAETTPGLRLNTRERHRASAAKPGSLDGGGNILVAGDNLLAAGALRSDFEGKIDLVYIDPPFATGEDQVAALEIGDGDQRSARSRVEPMATRTVYRDRWESGLPSYLDMLASRLLAVRPLLAPAGTVFVHVDRRVSHPVKLLLDEVFGEERLINEIVWCYTGPSSPGMKSFANKHDILFWYANGPRWTFNADAVRLPYNASTRRNEGRRTGFTTGDPNLVVTLNPGGKFPEDWWLIPVEAPASSARTSYPTQKPERLLERVLLAASDEGALVADFFCGSGTTLAVAERLGRRWIGCDSSPSAIHTSRKRLLGIPGRAAFSVARLEAAPGPASGERRISTRFLRRGAATGRLELTGFDDLRPELVPAAVLSRIHSWSDWIDYWCVDWDWSGGPIEPDFVSYRTRKARKLALACDVHGAPAPGPGRIAVQVIDVLGRETVQVS